MAFEEEFEVNKRAQIKEIANARKIQRVYDSETSKSYSVQVSKQIKYIPCIIES